MNSLPAQSSTDASPPTAVSQSKVRVHALYKHCRPRLPLSDPHPTLLSCLAPAVPVAAGSCCTGCCTHCCCHLCCTTRCARGYRLCRSVTCFCLLRPCGSAYSRFCTVRSISRSIRYVSSSSPASFTTIKCTLRLCRHTIIRDQQCIFPAALPLRLPPQSAPLPAHYLSEALHLLAPPCI